MLQIICSAEAGEFYACRFQTEAGNGLFPLATMSKPTLCPKQPIILWVPVALSRGVERPGCVADHSTPSSVETKNSWCCTFTHTTS